MRGDITLKTTLKKRALRLFGASAILISSLTLGSRAVAYTSLTDVVYDTINGTKLKMDVYRPSTTTTAAKPALIFIHGGCFSSGSKKDMQTYLKQFADEGFVVFSLDYRLSGTAKYPAAVTDVQQAIRYIRKNAASFQIDPTKIIAHGESAGGYLAAVLGVKALPDRNGAVDQYSNRVALVLDWYGRTDFSRPQVTGTDCAASFLGLSRTTANASKFAAASIHPYVDQNSSPFHIIHGTKDAQVEPIHSSILANKLWNAKKTATLTIAQGYEHSFHGGKPWEITRRYVLSFLGKKDSKPFTYNEDDIIGINSGQTSGALVGGYSYDAYYIGGAPYLYPTSATSGATFPKLFDDSRYGSTFKYSVPGPIGFYRLELFFAEKKLTSSNQRVFNVDVVGMPALLNLDIYALAGANTRLTRNIQVITNGSSIPFEFKSSKGSATLSAFSLKQVPY